MEQKKLEDEKDQKKKEIENQKIKKWEDKFDQELKLKEEEEALKYDLIKKKEQQKLILNGDGTTSEIEEFKLKEEEQGELKPKEDLITKLESFDLDNNKKN